MTKRMFTNNKFPFWLAGLILINVVVLAFVVINNVTRSQDMKMIKTKEPLLIEGPNAMKTIMCCLSAPHFIMTRAFLKGMTVMSFT